MLCLLIEETRVALYKVKPEHEEVVKKVHNRALQEGDDPDIDTMFDLLGGAKGDPMTGESDLGQYIPATPEGTELTEKLYWFFYN